MNAVYGIFGKVNPVDGRSIGEGVAAGFFVVMLAAVTAGAVAVLIVQWIWNHVSIAVS